MLIFSIVVLQNGNAQVFPVDTARLNNAYKILMKGNRTAETEMAFLESHPTTWLEFYMTYSYMYDENYDNTMCDMCSEYISTLFGLSHINDTVLCNKVVNLSIGMNNSSECTDLFQDYLVGYLLDNDELLLGCLSKLKKGYQIQFWQFCWSTVADCYRAEHFEELYNRNKEKYPIQMEMSRIAFENFYDGISYPCLLPHRREEYERKFNTKNYKYIFDDYLE